MTEAEIEQVFMSPEQQRAFQAYVALGDARSIPKLHEVLKTQSDIDVAEITLKRWSAKFKWPELAQRTDTDISNRIAETLLPDQVERTKRALMYIDKMKEKFYELVEAGEVKLTVTEFISVLKAEQLLNGSPTERREDVHTTRVQVEISDAELIAVARLSASKQRGLPAPDVIEGDAPEPNQINVTSSSSASL